MTKGTVTFYHDDKGYGFIEVEEEDDDVFFHVSDVNGFTPEEDLEVEFDTEQGDKGLRAVNVTKV